MPELPEVETVRSQLASTLVGQTIFTVTVRRPRSVLGNHQVLIGNKVIQVRRYSKLLLIDLSDGLSIAVHLKMTGRMIYQSSNVGRLTTNVEFDYDTHKHTHVVVEFEGGDRLYFHDQRTFGYLQIIPTIEVESLPYVKTLGPEFFRNLTENQFIDILKKSKRAIKTVLLDQQQVAGVGNIYANEGLWRAGIHPETQANTLTKEQGRVLFKSLSDVMQLAITHGGTSSDNFRDAYGNKGNAFERLAVYGRQGKPCFLCGSVIKKYAFAGRGTYFCPTCQNPNGIAP